MLAPLAAVLLGRAGRMPVRTSGMMRVCTLISGYGQSKV